jgi:hypothetical protein
MGKLNRAVVMTRGEVMRNSCLGFILGILMLEGAYYYFPMSRGYHHYRFVFTFGAIGLILTVLSVWAFVDALISKYRGGSNRRLEKLIK